MRTVATYTVKVRIPTGLDPEDREDAITALDEMFITDALMSAAPYAADIDDYEFVVKRA